MLVCPTCGAVNPATEHHCVACGTFLRVSGLGPKSDPKSIDPLIMKDPPRVPPPGSPIEDRWVDINDPRFAPPSGKRRKKPNRPFF